MKLSMNGYARRKRVIRDAMAKEDVDIILIGGSDKWEQKR